MTNSKNKDNVHFDTLDMIREFVSEEEYKKIERNFKEEYNKWLSEKKKQK